MKPLTRRTLTALVSSLGLAGSLWLGPEAAAQSEPRPHHEPPPEAYAACAGKAAADACTISLHDKTIAGTCAGADASALFCKPEHMPPPPPGDGSGDRPEGPPEGEPPQK